MKFITGLVVAVLPLTLMCQVLAWGPERDVVHWDMPADYRTINSIVDNPSFGDERNFVRIRKVGEAKFLDSVKLVAGEKYEVEIYFHNNASLSLNKSGKGIANNVRVSTILPKYVAKGKTAEVSATITASNTKPLAVWDEAKVEATSDVYLKYVPGTAVIHSNGTINGENVSPEYLFSKEGSLVGYSKKYWGVLPGCNEYAGYVSYQFVADQPSFRIAKEVSRDGKNDWKERITVNPEEELTFRIFYENNGTTEQSDVILKDSLPKQLVYLTGTTFLVNGSTPDGKFVSDKLFTDGLNIGRYQPKSQANLTYKVKMPKEEDLQCGENKFVNSASVATANGTMKDKVEISVVKKCDTGNTGIVPKELPETGPAEIVMAVVVILGIGGAGYYLYRTRKTLRTVEGKATGEMNKEVKKEDEGSQKPDNMIE